MRLATAAMGNRPLFWAVVALSAAAVFCAEAAASDGVRYGRDGQVYLLERSQTELAVRLREPAEAEAVGRRLAGPGDDRVVLQPGSSPASPWRILRTGDAGAARRSAIGTDPAVAEVHPVWRHVGAEPPLIASGNIALKVDGRLTGRQRDELFAGYGVQVVKTIPRLTDVYIVQPLNEAVDEVALSAQMHLDAQIVWAHGDFVCPSKRYQIVPQDEFFLDQWHLNNTGQLDSFGQRGTPGADISVLEAWEVTLGTDVLVGMFDDSVDYLHEDLREGYLGSGFDASLSTNDAGFTDPRPKSFGDRHGTAVMGLAVGRPNALGVRGVAPLARFTATRGLGQGLLESDYAAVYAFALQQEVDVHINSWGLLDGIPHPIVEDAIRLAFREGRDLDGDGTDPPLGMVIVFASGNDGVEIGAPIEFSMLETVIGVGASNADDVVATYSNFGAGLDVLAPSGDDFLPAMVTVDNSDGEFPENGYNRAGFDDIGIPNIDPDGKYTNDFGGTSAACPVASGVAALVLSVNRELTATQVRLILEHTVDRVSAEDASYHSVTGFSLKYGYGRINAARAVTAAQQSLANNGQTWPERPRTVVRNSQTATISWEKNTENCEYLLVESDDPGFGTSFGFAPLDGVCYVNANNGIQDDDGQLGCSTVSDQALGDLPAGVRIIHWQNTTRRTFVASGTKSFALYARNAAGRYSWGVFINSQGNVLNAGPSAEGVVNPVGGCEGGGNGEEPGPEPPPGGDEGTPPRVSIDVSPLRGVSPLTVSFKGNAVTDDPIVEFCCHDCNGNKTEDALDIFDGTSADENVDLIPDECSNNGGNVDDSAIIPCTSPFSQEDAVRCSGWDFTDDGIIDTSDTTTTNVYTTPPGETTRYRSRLTFTDTEGREGSQAVDIIVEPGTGDDPLPGDSDVRIRISPPGSSEIDLEEGVAPLDVALTIDASDLPGTLLRVDWDLGDGTVASSISVLHTYQNPSSSQVAVTFPITARVFTTVPSSEHDGAYVASRVLRVEPEPAAPNAGNGNIPGSNAGGGGRQVPCQMGLLPLTATLIGLALLRRRLLESRN